MSMVKHLERVKPQLIELGVLKKAMDVYRALIAYQHD